MREIGQVRPLAQGGFGVLLGMQTHRANAFCILSGNRAQQAVLVIRRHDPWRRFSRIDRGQAWGRVKRPLLLSMSRETHSALAASRLFANARRR